MRKLILLLLLLAPITALASSHTYTCAELSAAKGGTPAPTCSGGVWTFTGGSGFIGDWSAPAYNTLPAGSYHLVYAYSGSGTGLAATNGNVNLGGPEVSFGSSGKATITSDGTTNASQGIQIRANASLSATIGPICIDNDGSCSAAPSGIHTLNILRKGIEVFRKGLIIHL